MCSAIATAHLTSPIQIMRGMMSLALGSSLTNLVIYSHNVMSTVIDRENQVRTNQWVEDKTQHSLWYCGHHLTLS